MSSGTESVALHRSGAGGFARFRRSRWWEPTRNVLVALIAIGAFWLTVRPMDVAGVAIQYGLAAVALVGVACAGRFPWLGVPLSGAATTIALLFGLTFDPFVVTGVAIFTVAERRASKLFPAVMVAGIVALVLGSLLVGVDGFEARVRSGLLSVAVLVASWVLGARTRQARREAAARSRAEERLRIARDVHDVLSHSLGTIGVLAGVRAHVSDASEATLRDALHEIEERARVGTSELQALLDRERSTERSTDARPAPAAVPLRDTLAQMATATEPSGVATSLEVQGDIDRLPAPIRTTLQRIVQEALTNVTRHAQAQSACVVVCASASGVDVRVSDAGSGRESAIVAGHGISGMRERVELLQGSFGVEDEPGGGLAVVAHLPTDGTARP